MIKKNGGLMCLLCLRLVFTGFLWGSLVVVEPVAGSAARAGVMPSAGKDESASESPVADAAEQQNGESLRKLLTSGCDPNVGQADGATALLWAAYHDRTDLAELLIASGADAKQTNDYGIPPLAPACTNGNASLITLLLKAGADPNTTLPGGETVLMTAARTGRLPAVRCLLEAGAAPNVREHREQTALMWAAAEGHTAVVDLLLQFGADATTPLRSGFTPLFFAVREGRTETVLRLLQHSDVDINEPMRPKDAGAGFNPLLLAVENGHFETAVALLEAGADPDAQPKGHGALHAVTWVRKPIRGDGDPSPVGSGSVDPLAFVRAAVDHGANVNLALRKGRSGRADFTTTGCTPFVLAARTGDLPLVRLLLKLGADSSIANQDGATAILAACGIGDLGSGQESAGTEEEAIAVARLLLELGADINVVDKNGETVIHGAVYQGRHRLVDFLVDHGADPAIWHQPNRWGWTPLRIARGYRKGNFRPDAATIRAVTQALTSAGIPIPLSPGNTEGSNQQPWDDSLPQAGKQSPPKPAIPQG